MKRGPHGFKQVFPVILIAAAAFFSTWGCKPPDEPIAPPRLEISRLEAPGDLTAHDTPGDRGESITLAWSASPTENTPDFLIRGEIHRRQTDGIKSEKEKKRIHDEVEKLYSGEPRIEYRISSPRPYRGLMDVKAGLHSCDREKTAAGWSRFEEWWRSASGNDRLSGIVSLVRLGSDIDGTGVPPALQEKADTWEDSFRAGKTAFAERHDILSSLMNDNPLPSDGLPGRLFDCALTLLPLTQADGDKTGLHDFISRLDKPGRTFSRLEFGLEKAISEIGSQELAARAGRMMEELAASGRTELTETERSELAASLPPLEETAGRLWKEAERDLERARKALLDLFDSKGDVERAYAAMEENVSWGRLAAFPSGINFEKKEKDNTCEFRESGGDKHFFMVKELRDGLPYRFRVELAMGDQVVRLEAAPGDAAGDDFTVQAASSPDWFDRTKLNLLVIVVGLTGLILLCIQKARKNPDLFIRRIDGLNAVDQAVRKAAELGRPVYYIMGLGAMSDLPTIASLSILEEIALQTARTDLKLIVPCYDPVVMAAAQDVVRGAYEREGRLDRFRKEDIFFVTSDRFSYAASVDGMMVRDRPGLTLLLGTFQAESLLIAEVGSAIGAVQISGTDQMAQIPFFITTSDYTLIGEELYAASAYLSRKALMLGTLRGQDLGKALLLLAIVSGVILNAFDIDIIYSFFS